LLDEAPMIRIEMNRALTLTVATNCWKSAALTRRARRLRRRHSRSRRAQGRMDNVVVGEARAAGVIETATGLVVRVIAARRAVDRAAVAKAAAARIKAQPDPHRVMTEQRLRRSVLEDSHVELGARMVPFAGWNMPLQFGGILTEHRAVRSSAGVFDVSHMGRAFVRGEDAIERLQPILANDLSKIARPGLAQYSMLLTQAGGIIDDLIVYRCGVEELLLVVNAARADEDLALIAQVIDTDDIDVVTHNTAMIALQGPSALDVLADLGAPECSALAPFEHAQINMLGFQARFAATGYTGERGGEIIVNAEHAPALFSALVSDARVEPCGLGARDTLRLEACYPLWGNDIDEHTDPISAGLGFAAPTGIAGVAHVAIDRIRTAGATERLVAIAVRDRGIPRAGCDVRVAEMVVGRVTSGSMSPMLGHGIALAWVAAGHASIGTDVVVDVRGRQLQAQIVEKPFVRGSLSTASV
jgi:aminomethyltransferase